MLDDPGYLEAEDSTTEGNELIEKLRKSGFEKYKPEIDSMLGESSAIVTAITEDPITKEISQRVKSIHNHLWYDRLVLTASRFNSVNHSNALFLVTETPFSSHNYLMISELL